MIKLVIAAFWISIATTGAVLYSFHLAQPEAHAAVEEPNIFQGLDYVKTDVISVPLLEDGSVYGYFLARLVFTAEAAKLGQVKLPIDALLSDEIYSFLYANPAIDFAGKDTIDLEAFRNGLRDSVNARVGHELIREILIEQMDFLPKGEVQATSLRNAGATAATTSSSPAPAAH